MILNKIGQKGISIFKRQQEQWLGKSILKSSLHSSPDFMIIGAPKCGTTSLFQYLAQHPDILAPERKEIFYFSTQQDMGLANYLKNFPLKKSKGQSLTFEATPSYMYYKKGLERIKRLFPSIKLIAILRDPVKRAYSQWNFHRVSTFWNSNPDAKENRLFRRAIEDELNSKLLPHPHFQYIHRSLYSTHLNVLYTVFPHDQVLLVDFDDLKKKPQHVLEQVTEFLNIGNIYFQYKMSEKNVEELLQSKDTNAGQELKVYNTSTYKESIDKETEQFLRSFFKPYDEELKQLTGRKFSWME